MSVCISKRKTTKIPLKKKYLEMSTTKIFDSLSNYANRSHYFFCMGQRGLSLPKLCGQLPNERIWEKIEKLRRMVFYDTYILYVF